MRTIPQIVRPPEPIGADLAISVLQDKLSTITYTDSNHQVNWFGNGLIFGLMQRDEKDNRPIGYWKNKEYFDPFYDNYKSSCFFYETDPRNLDGRSHRFNFHLVVCYQQELFKRHLNYSIQENFIDAVLSNVLFPQLIEEDIQNIQVFTDTNTVFSNYDLNYINSKFKQDKHSCFRISFTHQDQISCKELVL